MQFINRLVVIGGGLAGREAARHAVRLGAEVTLVTRNLDAKRRLDQTAIRFLAAQADRVAQAWEPEGPGPDREYAPALRESLIGALDIASRDFNNAVADLEAIGVRVLQGFGCIAAPDEVSVTRPSGKIEYLNCCSIILAPGVEAFWNQESPLAITPASMPSLEEIPESLIVLGSSATALELAYFFSSCGVFVTVVGARQPALASLDEDLRDAVLNGAGDNRIRILADVTAVSGTGNGRVDILLSDGSHIDADYILPCGEGGYRTQGLGLEGPGVRVGPDGDILVDDQMRTNIPGILAVGSVTDCHAPNAAIKQARAAAENALGGESLVRYDLIPSAAWFDPQVGAVGMTEERARQAGIPILVDAVYIAPEPGPERWTKLVADESTGRVVGVHLVGDGAVEAVYAGALAIHAGLTLADIAECSFIEGTIAECIAAAAAGGRQPLPEVVKPLVFGPD